MHVQMYSIQRECVSTIDHRVVTLSAIGKIGAIARAWRVIEEEQEERP